ncbi:MAG: ribosome maturation factor RimM [Deltaproteobacteria bacterium]
MNPNNKILKYENIGRILKPFRNDGTLLALIDQQYNKDILKAKAIFIRINGHAVPFFPESIDVEDDLAYIKFEEFCGPEEVKPFNGSEILLRDTDIKNLKNKKNTSFNYNDLNGFIIDDATSGKQINITSIEQFPQQLMIIGAIDNNEVYIPLVENFIIEINIEKKRIKMNLPEGILNL